MKPARADETYRLADGVVALAPGIAWLPAGRTLLVADAHLAYEDVVGGALPLWSTTEIVATIGVAAERMRAREVVFLGDIEHGARMSEGAVGRVRAGLDDLRARMQVTLVAGNHEGRSRAFAVLGETVDACERDGWLLVHGDGAALLGRRTIIGHVHPSLHLGGGKTVPAFVASEALVVVPAMTPYSPGLDLCSDDFAAVLGAWSVRRRDAHVVAASADRVFPFGSLDALRAQLRRPARPDRPSPRRFIRRLRPDAS